MITSSEQTARLRSLNTWFSTTQGQITARAIIGELKHYKRILKGRDLLQVGVGHEYLQLPNFENRAPWIFSPDQQQSSAELVGRLDQWPLESKSLDLVFAPFTLESMQNTDAFIFEVDRVLKPMGLIVVIGINTWSPWSLALKTKQLKLFGAHDVFVHSPLSINRKFSHLGYRQYLHEGFWYIPPIKTESWLKTLTFLNITGKLLWPIPAGLYCFIAQKFDEAWIQPVHVLKDVKRTNAYANGYQPT